LDQSGIGNPSALDASLQLDAIFRAFPDLLFFIGADGEILDYRNGNTCSIPLPPEKILGHSMRDILPPEAGPIFNHSLRETLKTGKGVSMEYKLQTPEG